MMPGRSRDSGSDWPPIVRLFDSDRGIGSRLIEQRPDGLVDLGVGERGFLERVADLGTDLGLAGQLQRRALDNAGGYLALGPAGAELLEGDRDGAAGHQALGESIRDNGEREDVGSVEGSIRIGAGVELDLESIDPLQAGNQLAGHGTLVEIDEMGGAVELAGLAERPVHQGE